MRTDLHLFAAELGFSIESIEGRGLRACEEATELEIVEINENGREHLLIPAAAQAWHAMKDAAFTENIQFLIVSAFRSVERQAELVRRKLSTGQSIEHVLSVCAPPGFSEHHTGRAVDISTPGVPVLDVVFEKTEAFAWLTRNAAQFGFHLSYPAENSQGYHYEPRHWCFNNAQPGAQPDAQKQRDRLALRSVP